MRTLTSSFMLAVALPGAAHATTLFSSSAVLVSGDVSLSNVAVGGGVVVGGNANIYGGSRIGGNLNSSADGTTVVGVAGNMNFVNSTVSYGNVVYGGTNSSDRYNVVSTPNGTVSQGSVAVAGVFLEAATLSTYLAGLTATGSLSSQWGAGTLSGTSGGLNIYDITTSDLASLYSLTIVGGSSAIINVTGSDYSKYLSFNTNGISADNILFNFVDATGVSFSGADVPASILAPDATITMNGGATEGSLISKALSGGGATIGGRGYSGSLAGFTPQTAAVPEPASWLLMIGGFGMVGAALRRTRKPKTLVEG